MYGAAHQQPQEFTLVVDTKNLRDKKKKGVKINFVAKKSIPVRFTKSVMTKSGNPHEAYDFVKTMLIDKLL
jgi:hypothetical protein